MKVKFVKKGTIKPVKPFKSLEEEANFWDSHDAVEVFGKDIKVGFHRVNKTHTITIRFEPKKLQSLREKADRIGVGPTTLARMWIMEKLSQSA
ncbi:BrnA antitoxin family protein [Patescibacteria group bacterium]|nr:BrnA antitoxin family protein [Patescibacteria group bacterium]